MLVFRKRENMPIFAQICQEAATLAYRTFDGKITHIVRWNREALTGFREIDFDPRYDQ